MKPGYKIKILDIKIIHTEIHKTDETETFTLNVLSVYIRNTIRKHFPPTNGVLRGHFAISEEIQDPYRGVKDHHNETKQSIDTGGNTGVEI